MIKQKRILALLLVFAMSISLVACGDKTEKTEGEKDSGEVANETMEVKELYHGFALTNFDRHFPEQDENGEDVFSFNQIAVNALFDEEGRIVDLLVDQVEVGSDNSKVDSKLTGLVGQGGATEETFTEEVNNWKTKRELGEDYKLESGTWAEQMDAYQDLFIGKTLNEVVETYQTYFSDLTGKPLDGESENLVDNEKYEKLSEEDKTLLTDLTTSATMSINDNHGNIVMAIRNAAKNKEKVDVKSLKELGLGYASNGHVSGEVSNINEVFVNNLIDEDGKIASIFIDQLRVTSPNNENDYLPMFFGFPGKGSEDVEANEATLELVRSWKTKRSLGEDYKLESGTWSEQMDKIQEELVGKTKDEVEAWAKEYDGVSGATISIDNDYGKIVDAILKSFDMTKESNIKIK